VNCSPERFCEGQTTNVTCWPLPVLPNSCNATLRQNLPALPSLAANELADKFILVQLYCATQQRLLYRKVSSCATRRIRFTGAHARALLALLLSTCATRGRGGASVQLQGPRRARRDTDTRHSWAAYGWLWRSALLSGYSQLAGALKVCVARFPCRGATSVRLRGHKHMYSSAHYPALCATRSHVNSYSAFFLSQSAGEAHQRDEHGRRSG
jgi:hypothetical protein